jgi:hypothetical protein
MQDQSSCAFIPGNIPWEKNHLVWTGLDVSYTTKAVKCTTRVSQKLIPQIAFESGNKSRSRTVWRIEQVKCLCKTTTMNKQPA